MGGSEAHADVLVTGGTGFLGRALAARMPEARYLGSADVDLRDGRAVRAMVEKLRPRVVIDLAARVGGITANLEQPADFLVDNLQMGANLLSALRTYPPQHFVTMLSTCIYPEEVAAEQYPMTEDLLDAGPPPPTNAAYALSKRALWYGARALHEQYGVPYTALVPSNLYGPGDHYGSSDSHFLAAAIDKIEAARMRREASVEFFGTGRAQRQFLLVDDLARLIQIVVEHGPVNEALNVAPREVLSIRQLAECVAGCAGYEGEVTFSMKGPDGQIRKDADPSRLRERFPAWIDIETSLEDGVRRTLDWYRTHVATR